jgi:1,2-dihydroxy-3-keto-5-methylthiopentene dioxygenase
MALVRIPAGGVTLRGEDAVRGFLAGHGIEFERWPVKVASDAASAGDILAAYGPEVEALKARGGYVTADVIDVKPDTPGLDGMLLKFSSEHWHDEDEVRFIVEGRGLFHVHPPDGPVFAIEVEAGDLIRVPRGTHHWFDLCAERRIRAIRLFQDPSGWTPHYTDSGVDTGFQPVCFGPSYVGPMTGVADRGPEAGDIGR